MAERKNEITLAFRIFDFFDITHDDISKDLNLKPTGILVKGEYEPKCRLPN